MRSTTSPTTTRARSASSTPVASTTSGSCSRCRRLDESERETPLTNRPASMFRSLLAAAVLLALVFATSCSSGKGSGAGSTSQSTDTTTRANSTSTTSGRPRPAGPVADLSHEITGRTAPFIGAATTVNLARAGYVEHEYVAAGTASSYRAITPISRDGRWHFAPATKAAYRTRALVRRPAKAADFSGTVVVEWLNVSGGLDADPDWASLHEELLRR